MKNPEKIYYENGQVVSERWWIDGKLHRLDGPAYIRYYENGQVVSERWWIYGKEIEDMSDWLDDNGICMPFSLEDAMAINLRWL